MPGRQQGQCPPRSPRPEGMPPPTQMSTGPPAAVPAEAESNPVLREGLEEGGEMWHARFPMHKPAQRTLSDSGHSSS